MMCSVQQYLVYTNTTAVVEHKHPPPPPTFWKGERSVYMTEV